MSEGGGAFELTYEQVLWLIPRIIFISIVAIGILLLILSHFKSKYDISSIEADGIKQKVASCLKENKELNICLIHNTKYIKISYDDKSFIINEKNYNSALKPNVFNELIKINNELKKVKIEIV